MVYTKNAGRMQDNNLILQDTTAAITADALGTVGGAAANGIVDIGAAPVTFDVVIPIAAMTMGTDEEYRHQILGCNTSDFTTTAIVLLGELRVGAYETLVGTTGGIDTDTPVGNYILTVRNYTANGTVYRYVRYNYEEEAGAAASWTPGGDIYISQVRGG